MAVRCPFCYTLIIHRFNGNYNRMDFRRKQAHMKMCKSNPEYIKRNLKRNLKWGIIKGKNLQRLLR